MSTLPVAAPTTFDELLGKVQEAANTAVNDLFAAAQKIVDMLNDAANGIVNTLVSLIPFHDSDIDKAIDRWNHEINPQLSAAINSLFTNVQNAVDKLAGEPLVLKQAADSWANAATTIYAHSQGTVAQDLTLLGESWEGSAFDMFSTVANEQDGALQALRDAMVNGGTQTMAAAGKIQQLWIDLLDNFAGSYADVLNILSGLTDASSVISLELPGVLSGIATVWTRIENIAKVLLDFMNAQDTTDSYSWVVLAQGADGLPQNQWPSIGPLGASTMDDPGNWHAK